jgi:5-methylcytosine-specific restriction endonuclease McrA
MNRKPPDASRLDRIVADAQRNRQTREQGYRERALKMYPWICGRCSREFDHGNVIELTVHHRDHDHDNNPEDGSNWELLCVYCHDNEHARMVDAHLAPTREQDKKRTTHKAFANLKDLLGRD